MSEKQTKAGPGRPKAKINGKDVYKLARIGCNLNEIADFHDVDPITIKRRFNKELLKGKADVKMRLRKAQLQAALEDRQPTMLVWLGKQMLNQTDNGTFEEDELLDDIDFGLDTQQENDNDN
jgi:hypothetical protein